MSADEIRTIPRHKFKISEDKQELDYNAINMEWSVSKSGRKKSFSSNSLFGAKYSKLNCFQQLLSVLWTLHKPFWLAWLLCIETFLLIEIYYAHTSLFWTSFSLLVCPIVLCSSYIARMAFISCTSRFDSDRISLCTSWMMRRCIQFALCIPVLNLLVITLPSPWICIKHRVHYTWMWQSILVAFLSVALSVPQWVIQVYFILQTRPSLHEWHLDVGLHVAHLGTCVVSLSVVVLLHWAYAMLMDTINEEAVLKAVKVRLFWYKFGSLIHMVFYLFGVAILLEMLHCLPLLFEFFYYGHLSRLKFGYLLLAFNASKLICFAPYIQRRAAQQHSSSSSCWVTLLQFVRMVVMYTPLPLVPFVNATYHALLSKRVSLTEIRQIQSHKQFKKMSKRSLQTSSSTRISSSGRHVQPTQPVSITVENSKSADPVIVPLHKQQENKNGFTNGYRYNSMDDHDHGHLDQVPNENVNVAMDADLEILKAMQSLKCEYGCFVLYLCLAYIGCCAYLMYDCGGLKCLGTITQILACAQCLMVGIAIVIYSPFVLHKMMRYVSFCGAQYNHDDWAWL